jgi:hypothetical protein
MRVEICDGMVLIGKTEELRKKLVPLPLCPPQIPHGFILT